MNTILKIITVCFILMNSNCMAMKDLHKDLNTIAFKQFEEKKPIMRILVRYEHTDSGWWDQNGGYPSDTYTYYLRHLFFVHYSPDNTPLLIPIIINEKKESSLPLLANNYTLLEAARLGDVEKFRQALQDGAHITAVDNRNKNILYTVHHCNGTMCPRNAMVNYKGCMHLVERKNPIAQLKPYMGTYGHGVKEIVYKYFNIAIAHEMLKTDSNLFSEKDKKIINYYNQSIEKEDLILKNKLINSKQITPHQKFDRYMLAKSYAEIICNKDKEGKELIACSNIGNQFPIFTQLVMNNISNYLEANQEALIENLFLLFQKAIHEMPTEHAKPFISSVLSYCTAKVITLNGKDEKEIQLHNKLVHFLTNYNEKFNGKEFLKELCNNSDNKKEFPDTIAQIKSAIQPVLLQNYLIRTLSSKRAVHSPQGEKLIILPALPSEMAEHIVSYWNPNEKFKQYFSKNDKKNNCVIS